MSTPTNAGARKRRGLLALILLPLLFLTGCMKIDMAVELHSDNTATTKMKVLDKTGMMFDDSASGGDYCSEFSAEMEGDAEDVSVEAIEEEGMKGCLISGTGDLENLGALEDGSVTREGDVFHINIPSTSDGSEEMPPGLEISLSVTFPGEIIESSGGTIGNDGRTITWTGSETYNDMTASGKAVAPSNNVAIFLLAGLGVLLLGGAVFFVVTATRRKNEDSVAAQGTIPEWDGTSTVPPPAPTQDSYPQYNGTNPYPQQPQQQPYGQPQQPYGQGAPYQQAPAPRSDSGQIPPLPRPDSNSGGQGF